MRGSVAARILVVSLALSLSAADWPQWRGPQRDGISQEKGLLKAWPEGGPTKIWSVEGVGQGYATVAVVDGMVYTTGVFGTEGKLITLRDGKIIGTSAYGPDVDKGGGYPGTRSTPTVADGRIFVMSGFGVVTCFDQATGKGLWQVDTFTTFGGQQIGWNVAESLLVDGDRVICTPGGNKGLMAALDVRSGKTIWATRGIDSKSAYCSPVIATHNGRRIILTMVEYGAVGIDAQTGQMLWQYAHKNKYAVHAATPVYDKGKVFISSGYGYGSEFLEMSAQGNAVRPLWQQKGLDNHHGGIIVLDGFAYGTNDRGLVCIDLKTGQIASETKGVGKGSLVLADGQLYAYGERGTMGLIRPNPRGSELISSFAVQEGKGPHWAHPVVANGILYIRHGDVLMAYDVNGI